MSEDDGPIERRPLVNTDIEEGGWQKPVREPSLDARPIGLPKATPVQAQPQDTGGGQGASSDQAASGGDSGSSGGDA